MQLETKYAIGDVVYHVWGRTRRLSETCSVCKGAGKLPVVGVDEIVTCPKCYGHGERETGHDYVEHVIGGPLIVGQVRVQVEGPTDGRDGEHGWAVDQSNMGPRSEKREERYMANQTGIGSGTLYNVEDLFPSKEEAEEEARRRTAVSVDGIVEYEEASAAS